MGQPRVPQMYMQVNKTRHHIAALGVNYFIRLTGKFQGNSFFLDHAVLNIKVTGFVSLIRGI